MIADGAVAGENYAEWVRRTLARVRASNTRIVTLFDSSVPEPRELLTATVAEAFAEPVTDRYVSAFSGGNPFVVAQLASHYSVGPDNVICTTGATGALSLLYRALVRPGEHVLVETPGFDLFAGIGAVNGIAVDQFERAAPDFDLDVDRIARAIRPETRLIVLSNLHNPSGRVVAHDALLALASLAEARDVLVLVDEVYGDYADATARPRPAASLSSKFISVSSLTKIYGLSTLRCGWIVGDADLLRPVRMLAESYDFGVSNLAHAAAALVLENSAAFTACSNRITEAARPIVEAKFTAWARDGLIEGSVPPFGCIAFPRLVGIDDTAAFAHWLGNRNGVIVAPGEYFGLAGHIRIGFGQPVDDLVFALDALEEGLRAWRADGLRQRAAR